MCRAGARDQQEQRCRGSGEEKQRCRGCLELGAGDLSERTQLEELEEDVHFVFR